LEWLTIFLSTETYYKKEVAMNLKCFVSAIVFLSSVSSVVFADRPLERAEVLQIFQRLTSQPKKTWVPAGTIEATHEEYRAAKTTDPNEIERQIKERVQEYQNNPNKPELTENLQKLKLDAIPFDIRYRLSNEYTMDSTVVVRFDGERFYWEIKVQSRTDSIKPGKALEDNFMTKQFDLGGNARRIFTWDGEKYTTYFLPGNHAIVDSTGKTPHIVNGPLTAGIIPWGYGYYSYENLTATDSSAAEKYVDGQTQIHLTLNNSDGSEMLFVLDPGKEYAVLSCLIVRPNGSITSKQYSDYQLVSGIWVPAAILIEQYEPASKRLLASDFWHFTRISGDIPSRDSFDVEYENDALMEYRSAVTNSPLMYHHSNLVNTDLLLGERLTFAASEGTQPQNCAIIAVKYAASQLGKEVTGQELAPLVSEPDKTTSLYAMKQFVQSKGLYCRAVKTDIKTLKGLYGCQVILHIPAKNHFVVLAGIDREYVWCIDLANDKFYYRTDIDFFGMDWTEGTALLVSNHPIQGNFTEIGEDQLHGIIGGAGYTCTRLLQTYNVIFCSNPVPGACEGYYQEYRTRYGCEAAESGSCTGSKMIRYVETPCIEDPYDPLACTGTGEWTCYYVRACA
jgi:hypothetical protein